MSNTIVNKLIEDVINQYRKTLDPNLSYCVALSGGIDSIVLLDIMHTISSKTDIKLSAIHVNHGISLNAELWAEFCKKVCLNYNIPLQIKNVTIVKSGGQSLEDQARKLRYQAMLKDIFDVIILGHHQQDQVETFLSQVLRGNDIHVTAAMQSLSKKKDKYLWRPLLNTSKATILQYANYKNLDYVVDESNYDNKYLRNFLRNDIIPSLIKYDPHITTKITNTIHELQVCVSLTDELAKSDLTSCYYDLNLVKPETIDIHKFNKLSQIRQINLINYYIRSNNLPIPSKAKIAEFVRQVNTSRWERTPTLKINQQVALIKNKSQIRLIQQL